MLGPVFLESYKVRMYASKVDSIWSEEKLLEDGQLLKLSESDEWNVRCEFYEGNPEAHINITLGEHDITHK